MFSSCFFCGSHDIGSSIASVERLSKKETFHIATCGACGMKRTIDAPALKDIGTYYAHESYVSHTGVRVWPLRVLRTLRLWLRAHMISSFFQRKGSLLDIGCGVGDFAALIQKQGWNVLCIEPDESTRQKAQKQYKLDVRDVSALAHLPEATFDVITLWHVLEHMYDPLQTGATVKRLLNSEGVCIVAVPNAEAYSAEHYGCNWVAYDVPRHVSHFRSRDIHTWAERSGLEVIRQSSVPLDEFFCCLKSGALRGDWLFVRVLRAIQCFCIAAFQPKRASTMLFVCSVQKA